MLILKRSWLIIILLLLVSACNQEPEPTTEDENESPAATLAVNIPDASPSPTRQPRITPTLRATGEPAETAESQVQPISNAIYIRSGPGEGFNEIGLLFEDETADVVGTDTFGNWFEIVTDDGEEGWVAASVVDLMGEALVVVEPSPTAKPLLTGQPDTPWLRVSINSAFVRSGPGEIYPVIDSVPGGSTVTVLAHVNNGSWFNIRLGPGRNGWIGASVTEVVGDWELDEIAAAETVPPPPPTPQSNCDPAYPTVCIPSSPPDLDCRDIPHQNFTALPPDPHLFDGNEDGIGCGT